MWVAAGRGSRVFQRAKCLAHVMKIAHRGVEPFRIQGHLDPTRRKTLTATANIESEQKDGGKNGEGDECSEHWKSEDDATAQL